METTATIPLTVTPEATARIAELGMQCEFEQMIEHTRQTIPSLRAIRVTLEHDPYGLEEPGIVIWPERPAWDAEDDPTDRDWGRWMVTTFRPEVCGNFCMISIDPS